MGHAESKFKITTPVREILLNDERITALIGDKIFPVVAPNETEGDFIVYRRDRYVKSYTQMGISGQLCEVYVNVISDDYDRSQDLAYLVNEALEGTFSNPDMKITLIDSTEDFEDEKYIQVLLFKIE